MGSQQRLYLCKSDRGKVAINIIIDYNIEVYKQGHT